MNESNHIIKEVGIVYKFTKTPSKIDFINNPQMAASFFKQKIGNQTQLC
jgi:hypothetical protein